VKDFDTLRHTIKNTCNISAYSWQAILVRMVISSIIAIATMKYVIYALDGVEGLDDGTKPPMRDYLLAMASFIVLRELLIIIDKGLERILPIPKRLRDRIFLQIILSVLTAFIVIKIAMFISPDKNHLDFEKPIISMVLALSSVFVIFISSSMLMIRIIGKWLTAQENVESLKEEKMKSDYNALQDQLNPHFLFNNLSVLKSMIIYDKDGAIEFTEKFTDVYRYVLQSKDKMLVKFKDELNFIEAFIGIHKDRFGEGLDVKVSIDKKYINYEIAPLSLQLLVENAIKHNIACKESPLKLRITSLDDNVRVENSINLRESSYSTNTGLNNLIKRYSFLTEEKVVVTHTKEKFVVDIPLLISE
jgi:hypothetical protein